MKHLILTLGFMLAPVVASAQALEQKDLVGGYLIGREIGGDRVIEVQLRPGKKSMTIQSLRQGSRTAAPEGRCRGSAWLSEDRVRLNFRCPAGKGSKELDEYSQTLILPGPPYDLERGVVVEGQGVQFVVTKERAPYYN